MDIRKEKPNIVIQAGLLFGGEKNGDEDRISFCRDSLRLLGERYYSAFARIIDER